MKVSISEAKANLSQLVHLAHHGEKVVILKNGIPFVDLVPHRKQGKRNLGLLQGKFSVPDDFLEVNPEIHEMFLGKDG